MDKTYAPVTTAQELTEALAKCRAAQEKFATYTQEQVDKIFLAAATAANRMRIPLAKQAVAETGMGVVEDKVIKNHYAAEYIYNAYKDSKTCGVIEEDTAYGIQRIAEPIGVIAAVIPTTNPTSTAIFKTLISLKTRNGIIISPHPRAKGCTIAAARVVLEAAVAAGAPEGIIAWIDKPSLELTNQVMREADLILATGGPGMVKAAYSSGKPALGVGPGNTPAVIDDSADILLAVSSVIHSKTFDNGMICASEQSVVVLDSIYDRVKAEFIKRGCYVLNAEEIDKVRATILINGALNAKIVGQSAHTIAALAGVDVPESTKILIGEVTSTDLSEAFAHEKLSPVLAMYRASDFTDAMNKADTLVKDGGYGHTASVYLDTVSGKEKLDAFAEKMKACRILVNTPSSHGGIGDLYNFKLAPSLTLGCGSWGGNSVSENVGIKHLLNIKTVAIRRENMLWFRAPEKVYFKKGCLPVALAELKNYKKAFIVTDAFLYQNGYTKPVEEKLDAMGITHTTFYNVAPDPTLACAREGAAQMAAFKPDLILAIGGGSAMDAGKIMWVLYEHPEADFQDMAMRFVDIRKRVYTFPKMGEKAYFVAIPTTAGTGSEVTPFAVITDETTGVKYPLADYELLPKMAIVDALTEENARQLPLGRLILHDPADLIQPELHQRELFKPLPQMVEIDRRLIEQSLRAGFGKRTFDGRRLRLRGDVFHSGRFSGDRRRFLAGRFRGGAGRFGRFFLHGEISLGPVAHRTAQIVHIVVGQRREEDPQHQDHQIGVHGERTRRIRNAAAVFSLVDDFPAGLLRQNIHPAALLWVAATKKAPWVIPIGVGISIAQHSHRVTS